TEFAERANKRFYLAPKKQLSLAELLTQAQELKNTEDYNFSNLQNLLAKIYVETRTTPPNEAQKELIINLNKEKAELFFKSQLDEQFPVKDRSEEEIVANGEWRTFFAGLRNLKPAINTDSEAVVRLKNLQKKRYSLDQLDPANLTFPEKTVAETTRLEKKFENFLSRKIIHAYFHRATDKNELEARMEEIKQTNAREMALHGDQNKFKFRNEEQENYLHYYFLNQENYRQSVPENAVEYELNKQSNIGGYFDRVSKKMEIIFLTEMLADADSTAEGLLDVLSEYDSYFTAKDSASNAPRIKDIQTAFQEFYGEEWKTRLTANYH
ncbi:6495_t:CDS:2, partial [Funneliformis geosporum]